MVSKQISLLVRWGSRTSQTEVGGHVTLQTNHTGKSGIKRLCKYLTVQLMKT